MQRYNRRKQKFIYNPDWRKKMVCTVYGVDAITEQYPVDFEQSVDAALNSLQERERDVLLKYFRDGMALKQIGDDYGVTGNRVRQIRDSAECKLRHPTRYRIIKKGLFAETVKEQAFQAERQAESEKRSNMLKDIRNIRDPEQALEALEDVYVSDLDLGIRAFNCLMRSGVLSVADVIRLIATGGIRKIRNCGVSTTDEIIRQVNAFVSFHVEEGMPLPMSNTKNLEE